MNKRTRALCIANGRDGCSWYRVIQPARKLKALGLMDARLSMPGDLVRRELELKRADLVFMGRVEGRFLLKLTQELHRMGKAVVVDFDDDLFHVSPLNDAYARWGTEEVQVRYPDGSEQILWADLARRDELPDLPAGRFISLEHNRACVAALKEALSLVDAITVTTPDLAGSFQHFGPPVFILPNSVDLSLWQPLDLRKNHMEVRLGWSGGSSHFEDLNTIRGPLEVIMAGRPEAVLRIQGTHFKHITRGMDQARVQVAGWVDVEAHPYRSAALAPDLAVVPLADTPFNRRKSAIKWVEYAALEVPAICADMPPCSPVIEHGVNGILAGGPEAWEHWLTRLMDEPLLRAKLGGRARATVEQRFDMDKNAPLWAQALEAAREGRLAA